MISFPRRTHNTWSLHACTVYKITVAIWRSGKTVEEIYHNAEIFVVRHKLMIWLTINWTIKLQGPGRYKGPSPTAISKEKMFFHRCLARPLIGHWSQQWTCSKSTIEILEKGVKKMFKVTNKNTRTTSLTLFWCLYCQLWKYSTVFSSVSGN